MSSCVALHGFLGRGSDWLSIQCLCRNASWRLVDFFQDNTFEFDRGLAHVGRTVNDMVDRSSENNLLLGYSFGGRIALHALKEEPKLWSAAVLISTHPGLGSEKERADRFSRDKIWAEKFLNGPWDSLMEQWNSQPVFGGHSVERKPCDLSRPSLAQALLGCSLARQEDMRGFLSTVEIPILWLVGERDKTATALLNEIHFKHRNSKKVAVESAAHRLLWEAPNQVSEEISRFLEAAPARKRSREGSRVDLFESASHGQAESEAANGKR